MGNTEGMQVENGGCNLMSDCLCTLLGDLEVLRLEIVEEVPTLQVFHDDINVVRVLKHIKEPYNVRMLAHLEDLNFTF